MVDTFTPEVRSRTMRAVKSKNSKMEVKVRSALWKMGLRFYKNVEYLPGKPDIVFPRKKIVVFLDSCFWHGCPEHLRLPSSNKEYWEAKITRNRNRDVSMNQVYSDKRWRLIRIWEHELKTDFDKCLLKIRRQVSNTL